MVIDVAKLATHDSRDLLDSEIFDSTFLFHMLFSMNLHRDLGMGAKAVAETAVEAGTQTADETEEGYKIRKKRSEAYCKGCD